MSSLLAVRVRLWLDRRRQTRKDREWLKGATLTDVQSELNARRTQWTRAQAQNDQATFGFSAVDSDGERVDPRAITPIYPDEAA